MAYMKGLGIVKENGPVDQTHLWVIGGGIEVAQTGFLGLVGRKTMQDRNVTLKVRLSCMSLHAFGMIVRS